MRLCVDSISKKVNNKFLFKDLSFECTKATLTAITGPNGSGKSTLLKIILGYTRSNSGRVYLKANDKDVIIDRYHTAMGGVGMDFFPELKVIEIIDLYARMRTMNSYFNNQLIHNQFPELILNNQYQNLSSGWKNKLKVFLALMTQAEVVLLDEPFSNIDQNGIAQLKEIISLVSNDCIIIIATNREEELKLCSTQIDLTRFSNNKTVK
jgi:ABC-type multidrug transport system ATPase subunit